MNRSNAAKMAAVRRAHNAQVERVAEQIHDLFDNKGYLQWDLDMLIEKAKVLRTLRNVQGVCSLCFTVYGRGIKCRCEQEFEDSEMYIKRARSGR